MRNLAAFLRSTGQRILEKLTFDALFVKFLGNVVFWNPGFMSIGQSGSSQGVICWSHRVTGDVYKISHSVACPEVASRSSASPPLEIRSLDWEISVHWTGTPCSRLDSSVAACAYRFMMCISSTQHIRI